MSISPLPISSLGKEYDKQIMLEVFEEFLKDPRPFIVGKANANIATLIDKYCPNNIGDDPIYIRRHVIAFLSEFVLDPQFVNAHEGYELNFHKTDYLTWNGQQLYTKLKNNCK